MTESDSFEEVFDKDFPELSDEEHKDAGRRMQFAIEFLGNINNPPHEVMASFVQRAQAVMGKEMSDTGKRILSVMLLKLFAGYMVSQGESSYAHLVASNHKAGSSVH